MKNLNSDIAQFLSTIFLFESLTADQIELLEAFSALKNFRKGEHLFSDGQRATAFFIIVSGKVKLYKLSADGNEQILHIQTPGDLVAEAIIFDFETYPAYCQALEDTTLIRLPKSEFIKLLEHFPGICFKIMSAYSRRLRHLVALIEELSLHDIKSRLAKYLIQNSRKENNQRFCELMLSKKDLASVLGTIPETLSRTLNYFKKEKIIAEKKNDIIILDLSKLKMYVQ